MISNTCCAVKQTQSLALGPPLTEVSRNCIKQHHHKGAACLSVEQVLGSFHWTLWFIFIHFHLLFGSVSAAEPSRTPCGGGAPCLRLYFIPSLATPPDRKHIVRTMAAKNVSKFIQERLDLYQNLHGSSKLCQSLNLQNKMYGFSWGTN